MHTAALHQMLGCVEICHHNTTGLLGPEAGARNADRNCDPAPAPGRGGSLPSPDCVARAPCPDGQTPGVRPRQNHDAGRGRHHHGGGGDAAAAVVYPPDPGSMKTSTLGGNVAETPAACASNMRYVQLRPGPRGCVCTAKSFGPGNINASRTLPATPSGAFLLWAGKERGIVTKVLLRPAAEKHPRCDLRPGTRPPRPCPTSFGGAHHPLYL